MRGAGTKWLAVLCFVYFHASCVGRTKNKGKEYERKTYIISCIYNLYFVFVQ